MHPLFSQTENKQVHLHMEKECFSVLQVERGINYALPSPGREDMGQCNVPQMTTVASLREETQKDPNCISDTEPSAPPRPLGSAHVWI